MGYFIRPGGGAGVSVHEESSYTALATAAKTLPHEQLMRDTSTDFYYKNWKTGGPGIPVPVQYFDDVTGYASNGTGNTAYFEPSDALADIEGRGWVKTEVNGGTVTKTAGNALTLTTTTTAGSKGEFAFSYSAAPYAADRVLIIATIESFTPTTAMSSSAVTVEGSAFHYRPNDGGTRYTQYSYFNHDDYPATANISADAGGTGGSLGLGDFQSFTSGAICTVTEISNARSLSVAQDLSQERIAVLARSGARTLSSTVGYPIQIYARVLDAGYSPNQAVTFKVTECHCLEMS